MCFIPDATGPKNHSCRTDKDKKMGFTYYFKRKDKFYLLTFSNIKNWIILQGNNTKTKF